MLHIPDAATGPIQIEIGPAGGLAECLLGGNAAGPGEITGFRRLLPADCYVPVGNRRPQRNLVYAARVPVQQTGPIQLTQNGYHATCPMNILHVVQLGRGRHLAQIGNLA